MIALFAALVGPWFINWDDYKANFEAEAEKILGQPVRVAGSAKASILPSPSLTFTNVEVGDTEGQPMMTVEKFSVTIELMPLLEGEIRVVTMRLDKPVVAVSTDDAGLVDWLIRSEASKALDPDKVVLDDVEISDGTLAYRDAQTGLDLVFSGINATISARSLAGPWRVEGTYQENGVPVAFQFATGRQAEDGSLRIKTDVTPAELPFAIAADGVVRGGADGLSYAGTYAVTEVVATGEDGKPAGPPGWRSEGSFTLTRDRLLIDRAVVSEGPPDRPSSLAGSMAIDLGRNARFTAQVEARQLDLDRSLGEGPKKPADVGTAARSLVAWLSGLPVPGIPGRLSFNVPGIVVGGAVIQDVRFDALLADGGWQIEGLHARLPGQATIDADGTLSTGERVGFGGAVRLAVGQPATFASWWRGRSELGAGRLLAPFELSGRATINLSGIQVEDMETTIGEATIRGGFAWTAAGEGSPLRLLRTDLSADRLDFSQVQALAELLAGQDLGDTTALADSYAIRFVADELAIRDITMRDVEVDAGFEDGDLTVNGIDINDIGGAAISVTRGRIDDVLTDPRGRLEAQLNASTLAGLARIVDGIAADTTFARWFNRAAPSLSPASISAVINSGAAAPVSATTVQIIGDAAETKVEATIDLAGVPAAWRTSEVKLSASLKSHDAMGMARQTGLPVQPVTIAGGAQVAFTAAGVPATGMATAVSGSFAGLTLKGDGSLILAADLPPKFSGTFTFDSSDIDPLMQMAGLRIPGAEAGMPAKISGNLAVLGLAADLDWSNGAVAGRRVGGKLRLTEGAGSTLRFDGALDVDAVDLGWIAALGLGFAPLPTGEGDWPATPFGDPVLAGLGGKLDVTAQTITIGDRLAVANPVLTFALAPNRIDFDVKSGAFTGGSVVGGMSIRNVGGNANLTGQFSLIGGTLGSVVWQRAGRSVAVGTLDLSADFEATGRSPAGLVSSLTGGGTLAVHDGEVRYVNPRAVSLVVRSADLGQEFTEDALRDLLGSYIDAGALPFTEVEGPFSIAAGTVRFQNMTLDTAEAKVSGSAAIDLNTLAVDSDWSLTLETGDPKDEAAPPQIGLVFRGPLAEPSRIIDVLQFSSYLNIRQEQRIQEILALEEMTRLENERFKRERRRIQEEAERKAREEKALHEAQAAAAARLEAFHVAREIAGEERAVAELAAAQKRAAELVAAKAAADAAAADAKRRAEAAGAAAAAASAEAARKARDFDAEGAEAARAAAALRAAADALALAKKDAAAASAAAEQAAAAAGSEGEAAAAKAVKAATAERTAADAAAKAAAAKASAAGELAERANADAAAAEAAVKSAEQAAIAAIEAAQRAVEALDAADQARLDAEARATAASSVAAISAESAGKAEDDLKEAEAAAKAAAAEADRAAAAEAASRTAAKAAVDAAVKARAEQAAADAAARVAGEKAAAAAAAYAEAVAAVDAARRKVAEAGASGALDIAAIGAASAEVDAAETEAEARRLDAERLKSEAEQVAALAAAKANAVAVAKAAADGVLAAQAEASAAAADRAAAAEKAKVDAAVKAAAAAAARTAADDAARDAAVASEAAKAAALSVETAAGEVSARKTAAEQAAAAADVARDSMAAARDKAVAAEGAAAAALAERDRLVGVAAQKADAEAAAVSALAAAEAGREKAEAAAADAAAAAKAAGERVAVAKAAADEATAADTAARAALERVTAARDAAAKAASEAVAAADAAEAAAKAAAAKAAAMPSALVVPGLAGGDVGTVASVAPLPEPALAPEPSLPLESAPAIDGLDVAPLPAMAPPMPRPRPLKRPTAGAATPAGEPLVLTPAQ